MRSMHPTRALALLLPVCLLAACAPTSRQAPRTSEDRAAARFDSLRAYPGELRAFLRAMPKGGDLHNHLSGAVYAETFIDWAAGKNLCATPESNLVPPPCRAAAGQRPVAEAVTDPDLRRRLIDAWSMRGWSRPQGGPFGGHEQFFAAFGRFGPATDGRGGAMLAEAVSRAARGNVSYLELMQTLDGGTAMGIGLGVGWDVEARRAADADFDRMVTALQTAGIDRAVEDASENARRAGAVKDSLLACGTARAEPGCDVAVRWLYQVLREGPPERVFAQILTGFLLADAADNGVVGLNLVQPEDGFYSLRDYSLHMRFIGFLKARYPHVQVSLHAGELAVGLVPPEELTFHIREAVHVAGASRIGHGVAVMHEERPYELLRDLRERNILVEICLSSNDGILGVRGADHPLRTYRNHGVPLALATDDEGVSRGDLTTEFHKAAIEQGLGYRDLKEMARRSIDHAFVEEAVKTRLRDRLERDFAAFEADVFAVPARP